MWARCCRSISVERRAVGGAAEEQVQDRPDEGEAAGLAGEPAHHFGAPADLPKDRLEQVRGAPPFAVPERVAQMHDERVEVISEAASGGFVAVVLELVDQFADAFLAVFGSGRVVQCGPVVEPDPVVLVLRDLRLHIPQAVNATVLTIRARPDLPDDLDQPGCAVGDDHPW